MKYLLHHVAFYSLLCFGVLAIGYAAATTWIGWRYQTREQARFAAAADAPAPAAPFTVMAPPAPGAVIGEMQVPRLGLTSIVVEGDSFSDLRHAVGHLPATALPGADGNFTIAGHRDTFFRPLRNIQVGDTITMTTPGGALQYQVESTSIVSPNDVGVLRPSAYKTLTLITCYPFYYVGPAPKRFIVRAKQIDGPAA